MTLTEIRAISDEQPPSVSYTRGYAELPILLHRIHNEPSRFARIFREYEHCSLLSRPFLYSQKGGKDGQEIKATKSTRPVQNYEVRIYFYIHFTKLII